MGYWTPVHLPPSSVLLLFHPKSAYRAVSCVGAPSLHPPLEGCMPHHLLTPKHTNSSLLRTTPTIFIPRTLPPNPPILWGATGSPFLQTPVTGTKPSTFRCALRNGVSEPLRPLMVESSQSVVHIRLVSARSCGRGTIIRRPKFPNDSRGLQGFPRTHSRPCFPAHSPHPLLQPRLPPLPARETHFRPGFFVEPTALLINNGISPRFSDIRKPPAC